QDLPRTARREVRRCATQYDPGSGEHRSLYCQQSRAATERSCIPGQILMPRALLLLTISTVSLFAQALSPLQQKIVNAVNADEESSVQLLEKLVNINSGTLNPEGVKTVA